MKEIEDNDDWSCFVCNKDILKRMRAQHWALRNFMNKQLEKIQKIDISSEDELTNLLNDDLTTCCPKKRRRAAPTPRPTPPAMKRPGSNGPSPNLPPAKRPALLHQLRPTRPLGPMTYPRASGPRIIAPKRGNDLVCTPDILGMASSSGAQPPPLAMRQLQRPAGPRGATNVTNPIYHTGDKNNFL